MKRWADIKLEMHKAIRRDDIQVVERLLSAHPRLKEVRSSLSLSMVEIAARYASVDMLRTLVSRGCELSGWIDECGRKKSPLDAAADAGRVDTVRWLLSQGVEADTNKGRCATPLITAARAGHREIVELLLDAGADIHASYLLGDDPHAVCINSLKMAMMYGQRDVVLLLRQRGATMPEKSDVQESVDENDTFARFLQHLATHLGPLWGTLNRAVPGDVNLGLHIVEPSETRVMVVTSGVSDATTSTLRCELYCSLPPEWPTDLPALKDHKHYWPLEWLQLLATRLARSRARMKLPACYSISKSTNHVHSRFTHAILAKSELLPPFEIQPGDNAVFYEVVPVFHSEVQWARRSKLTRVVDQLRQLGPAIMFDDQRAPVNVE
jgi:hypothetical protein